jgi:peptidoglycan hydrolase CwlO-like protein
MLFAEKIKMKKIFLTIFIIFFLAVSMKINSPYAFGEEICDSIEECNEKAEAFQKILDLKNKQEQTLNNQVDVLNAQTGRLQSQISLNQNKIGELNNQIDELEKRIKSHQDSMDRQKIMLSNLIQEYAITKQEDPVDIFVTNNNLSDLFGKNDRIAQMESEVKDLYDNIKSIKTNLENERDSIKNKKKEIISEYASLQDKKSDLNDTIDQKQSLISQTQGEEEKYQKLLERVEQEKAELLDIDELGAGLSADNYDKPSSKYFASTDWYYSQKDSRWGNKTIGNSKTLMKSYGCAVTSVAMVFNYFGGSINPGQLAKKSIFSWDLISWPDTWSSPDLELVSGSAHGNVSWSKIDSEIKNGNPVIVYIQKTKGSGGHYVVIHHKTSDGKYVVHDPYWGANIYLNTSRALVGQLAPQSGTTINQMIIYEK